MTSTDTTSSTVAAAVDLLGKITDEIGLMQPLLPTYAHLLVSALFPIYTAAHAALTRPKSAAPRKKTDAEGDDDAALDETSSNVEALTPSDAILFPVLAGCTLAGLYFILKWLQDPAILNKILGYYFAFVGFYFATCFIRDGLVVGRSFVLPLQYSLQNKLFNASHDDALYTSRSANQEVIDQKTSPLPGFLSYLPLTGSFKRGYWKARKMLLKRARLEVYVHRLLYLKSSVEILDVVAVTLSAGAVGYHTFVEKPWYLTNLLGFSFCYGSLQFVTPGTAWTGSLILGALFLYDIYFVFYTPMMVTVATKLDVPIKLLFPRPDGCVFPVGAEEGSKAMRKYFECIAKKRTMAMLGLGDIVVPGMILTFALRFDLYLFYLRLQQANGQSVSTQPENIEKPTYRSTTGSWGERFWTSKRMQGESLNAKSFPKTYFRATTLGYVFGMVATVVVMQVFQHAQPALLYLVPGVLTAFWGTALVNGDIKELWNYSEMPSELQINGKEQGQTNEHKNCKIEKSAMEADSKQSSISANSQSTHPQPHAELEVKQSPTLDKGGDKSTEGGIILNNPRAEHLLYISITPLESKPKSIQEASETNTGKIDTATDSSTDATAKK